MVLPLLLLLFVEVAPVLLVAVAVGDLVVDKVRLCCRGGVSILDVALFIFVVPAACSACSSCSSASSHPPASSSHLSWSSFSACAYFLLFRLIVCCDDCYEVLLLFLLVLLLVAVSMC